MSNFRVGQKVVCVDDTPCGVPGTGGGMDGLRSGCVYTIRKFGTVPHLHPCVGLATCFLEEIKRPILDDRHGEIGYDLRRFRPVVTRETDISIFTAMLNPQKLRTDA